MGTAPLGGPRLAQTCPCKHVLVFLELVGEAPLGNAPVHVEHLVKLLVLLVLLELEGGVVEYLVKLLVFLELLNFLSFPMAMSSSILEGFT